MYSRSTPPALLSRIRNPQDHDAWREFDARYRELLLRFCRRRGVPHVDAEDLVQQVFANLATSISRFVYDPQRGRFRDYLYRCTQNVFSQWAARPNRRWEPLDHQGEPNPRVMDRAAGDNGETMRLWEEEWVAHHYRLAMQTVRQTFDETSVAIFDRSVAGAKVCELAGKFDMTEQAVHKVRQRIRDRMEELIADQIRDEDVIDDPSPP